MRIICVSKADGTFWEPSHPGDWNELDATLALFAFEERFIDDNGEVRYRAAKDKRGMFYFREVVWQPRKWWRPWGRWVRTGDTWEPLRREFDVYLGESHAK